MSNKAHVYALAVGCGLFAGAGAGVAHAVPAPAAAISGLQISVASTGASRLSDGSVSLEVTFKGGNLRSVELHLDGFLIKKQAVRTKEGRGVITFSLDGLTEGSHEALVKAVDVDGTVATTTTTLRVGAPEVPEVLGGGTRFDNLKSSQMVQGVFPIELDVAKSIKSPYVTYLIDNEFLAFLNYAPFAYNWDTTRMTNGQHTISVEIYDGETLNKVDTLTLKVNVNNPGGLTKIKRDLNPIGISKASPLGEAETILGDLTFIGGGEGLLRAAKNEVALASNLDLRMSAPGSVAARDIAPIRPLRNVANSEIATLADPSDTIESDFASAAHATSLETLRSIASIGARDINPLSNSTVTSIALPGEIAALVERTDLDGLRSTSSMIARLPLHLKRGGNVTISPSLSLYGGGGAIAVHAATPVVKRAVASKRMGLNAMRLIKGPFGVMFGDKEVAFDVTPRVSAGVPLAPFRAIFETSGGEVTFANDTKTVHATSPTATISIKIGDKSATVNDKSMKMESKAFLENGRTIVPISFLRDALDVLVSYDPATGHLLIERKK